MSLSRCLAVLAFLLTQTGCSQPAEAPGSFRLGLLAPSPEWDDLARRHLLPVLADLGFAEGRNLKYDSRVGPTHELPGLAREIIAAEPTVVVVIGPPARQAVRAVSASVPIAALGDGPMLRKAARDTQARPENLTGVQLMTVELHGKRLELLHRAVPEARKVAALLRSPWSETEEDKAAILRAAADQIGLELQIFLAADRGEFGSAFAQIREAGSEAVLIGSYPGFVGDATILAELALREGLPTMCPWADSIQSGCLLGYSAKREALLIRLAHLVAQILRGSSPSDLPIELPAEVELGVNLHTAGALGLSLPEAILGRADYIVE